MRPLRAVAQRVGSVSVAADGAAPRTIGV